MAWLVLVAVLSLRLMAAAPPMSAAEVGTLEDLLAQAPDDLDVRARLLEFYFDKGDVGEWGRHELWLVEHQPGSDLHRAPVGLKAPDGDALIAKLAAAWRKAVAAPAAPVDVLRNAAQFFDGVDAGTSLALLQRVRVSAPEDGRVFHLLLDGYLAMRTDDQALVELENGQDAEMMWMVGRSVDSRSRGERLMARAKEIDPGIAEKSERSRRVAAGAGMPVPRLVFKVAPVYSELAKEKRIEGVVRFRAIVTGTGEIVQLTLVSGHPLLVKSAVDAVKQWRYRPAMVNGVAVEVVTQVEVPFTLER